MAVISFSLTLLAVCCYATATPLSTSNLKDSSPDVITVGDEADVMHWIIEITKNVTALQVALSKEESDRKYEDASIRDDLSDEEHERKQADSELQDCYVVELTDSTGAATTKQGSRMGVYQKQSYMVNGKPAFEHAEGDQLLFQNENGKWMIGTKPGVNYGELLDRVPGGRIYDDVGTDEFTVTVKCGECPEGYGRNYLWECNSFCGCHDPDELCDKCCAVIDGACHATTPKKQGE